MSRPLNAIAPVRMGIRFRWLLASSWTSNLADGLSLAAGPLLVASQTDDPLLVAAAAFLQRAPWLIFGLYAGVIADRVDRRWLMIVADAFRAAVLTVLSVMIVTDTVSVAAVLVAMFALGSAEIFADVTAGTLLPMLVQPEDLGVGNARLIVGHITANQLAGPPIGAALFTAGVAWPFVTQGVLLAMGAVMIARIGPARAAAHVPEGPVRRQMVDGIRWLWHHGPIRMLTITIVTFNVTFGAAISVLVLYASQRLGLDGLGFAMLMTVSALGGVVGSWSYGWIERHVSLAAIMRIGLIVETATHLVFAVTTTPAVAMAVFFVFGVHTGTWGTTANSIRQRAVPAEFQGRVGSVYLIAMQGGIVVGSVLGGVIASVWGITGPFWFAFVGSAMILVLIWRHLDQIAHAESATVSFNHAGRG